MDAGPYAITRDPMYVGWWLIQLGAGTLAGSSWVLALLPVELLVEHRFVLEEEAVLARLFPQSCPAYTEKVPRYLGLPRMQVPWAGTHAPPSYAAAGAIGNEQVRGLTCPT